MHLDQMRTLPAPTATGCVGRSPDEDGRPANNEDLLVHYALGRPYAGQHGDDERRCA